MGLCKEIFLPLFPLWAPPTRIKKEVIFENFPVCWKMSVFLVTRRSEGLTSLYDLQMLYLHFLVSNGC